MQRFQNILLHTDGATASRFDLYRAVDLAKRNQGRLTVVVGPWKRLRYRADPLAASAEFEQKYRPLLEQRLKEFVGNTPGVIPHFAVFDACNHRCGIAAYARQVRACLVVLGAKGRTNLRYVMLSSAIARLLRDVPCSVLAVRPSDEGVRVPLENPDQPL